MPVAEDVVRESLKSVVDPELFVNIVDLGLIYEIIVFHEIHPGQSLTVAAVLALLPYPFLRGLLNRVVCRWRRSHGGPRRDVAA